LGPLLNSWSGGEIPLLSLLFRLCTERGRRRQGQGSKGYLGLVELVREKLGRRWAAARPTKGERGGGRGSELAVGRKDPGGPNLASGRFVPPGLFLLKTDFFFKHCDFPVFFLLFFKNPFSFLFCFDFKRYKIFL
jgi:hypothetical protein